MKISKILKPAIWSAKSAKDSAKKWTDWDDHFGPNGNVAQIKDMALTVKKQKYRNETFDEAMSRQGMNDKDLKDAYKYHLSMFKFWAFSAIVVLCLGIYSIVKANYIVALPTLAFMAFTIGICYQSSYRCYSINHRALGVVKQWKKSGEWFPKPFKAKSQSKSMVQS